jgi:hypothetical protein
VPLSRIARRLSPSGFSLDTGALLLGRRTWQLFAGSWPGRDDSFSAKMNAIPKLVMSRSLEHADGWQNTAVLRGRPGHGGGKAQAGGKQEDGSHAGTRAAIAVVSAPVVLHLKPGAGAVRERCTGVHHPYVGAAASAPGRIPARGGRGHPC